MPRPRKGASARCRSFSPLVGVRERHLVRRSFFLPMNGRLLIPSAVLVAVFANVGTIVFLILAPLDGAIWPILGCAVAGAATLSIVAIHTNLFVIRPTDPTPAPLSPARERSELRVAEASQPIVGQAPLDDPLSNKPLMSLVEECVSLFDELDRLRPSLEPAAQDFADHMGCRIQEVLERSGVTIIAEDLTFDRHRHQSEATAETPTDGASIGETQSPGFAVGRRVFRRARVKLAEVATTEKGPSP